MHIVPRVFTLNLNEKAFNSYEKKRAVTIKWFFPPFAVLYSPTRQKHFNFVTEDETMWSGMSLRGLLKRLPESTALPNFYFGNWPVGKFSFIARKHNVLCSSLSVWCSFSVVLFRGRRRRFQLYLTFSHAFCASKRDEKEFLERNEIDAFNYQFYANNYAKFPRISF